MNDIHGVPRAQAALAELRAALDEVSYYLPFRSPANQPTVGEACATILEVMRYHLTQIETFLGSEKNTRVNEVESGDVQTVVRQRRMFE
jgi:hypothetical protein